MPDFGTCPEPGESILHSPYLISGKLILIFSCNLCLGILSAKVKNVWNYISSSPYILLVAFLEVF
jgi:hypothetical protein